MLGSGDDGGGGGGATILRSLSVTGIEAVFDFVTPLIGTGMSFKLSGIELGSAGGGAVIVFELTAGG